LLEPEERLLTAVIPICCGRAVGRGDDFGAAVGRACGRVVLEVGVFTSILGLDSSALGLAFASAQRRSTVVASDTRGALSGRPFIGGAFLVGRAVGRGDDVGAELLSLAMLVLYDLPSKVNVLPGPFSLRAAAKALPNLDVAIV